MLRATCHVIKFYKKILVLAQVVGDSEVEMWIRNKDRLEI